MSIKVVLDEKAFMPSKAHSTDAGFDLYAMEDACIKSRDGIVINTGVHMAIPEGYVGYVQSRSGLNIKRDIICPTGTIDCGYTGSINVKLYNLGENDYSIHAGDRIAQLVIQPISTEGLELTNALEDTDRGAGGFGSTGA